MSDLLMIEKERGAFTPSSLPRADRAAAPSPNSAEPVGAWALATGSKLATKPVMRGQATQLQWFTHAERYLDRVTNDENKAEKRSKSNTRVRATKRSGGTGAARVLGRDASFTHLVLSPPRFCGCQKAIAILKISMDAPGKFLTDMSRWFCHWWLPRLDSDGVVDSIGAEVWGLADDAGDVIAGWGWVPD